MVESFDTTLRVSEVYGGAGDMMAFVGFLAGAALGGLVGFGLGAWSAPYWYSPYYYYPSYYPYYGYWW